MTCPSCRSENRDGAKFCSECGTALAVKAPPPREERKLVTVLFCDLVGFTQRSEAMDPEDVRALLRRYHEHLRGELERFGGTVEKFIGDAVVAVFGAPVAHEDDPERAVRAALAIRDWAREQEGLELRIAVNTGEALVTLGADPARGEGMVAGDVVNTASRLQSAAPVNGILVGERTYRATRERIDYREAEQVEAKGKSEPLRVWEALEARSRADVERPARTSLVGRKREIAQLREALARAVEQKELQLVTLVGVPGIGKSRLVYELYNSIEEGSELVSWRRGRSLPYGEGVSFWALGEIVKAQAGILESDSVDVAAAKLREAVAALVDGSDVEWATEQLAPLVGARAGSDPRVDRREEAFGAWRRFLEALAERRALVLVLEDLHWADEGLLDFVEHLITWTEGVPLVLVCTSRPELLERRPAWGGGKVNATTVLLSPLTDDETAQLVHELLGRAVLPVELQTAVVDRAGGNPLYAEEFARLFEAGDRGVDVPESVQGIVAARLDLLEPAEKRLLQDAAVVGRVFWPGALAAVGGRERPEVDRALHGLVRREFVQRERRSSVAGETEHAFRHALVRDVAYAQIPRADRAERHRRAANWIEGLGRGEDHAELLAHHYLAAVRLTRTVGGDVAALVDRGVTAILEAGDRALRLGAFEAAARLYGEFLELAPGDERRPSVLLRRGEALKNAGDPTATTVLEEARDAQLEAGFPEHAAEAEALLAEVAWHRREPDSTLARLANARELVAAAHPSRAKARVLAQACRYLVLEGENEAGLAVGLEALAMAEELGLDELRAHALNYVGLAAVHLGDESGMAKTEESVRIAERLGLPELPAYLNNHAVMLSAEGDYRGSAVLVRRSEAMAERLGHVQVARFQHGNRVGFEYVLGNWDDALRIADRYLAVVEAGHSHVLESRVRQRRSLIRYARGDTGGALTDMARAVALAREPQARTEIQHALACEASLLLAQGRSDEATARIDEALAHVEAHGVDDVFALLEVALYAASVGRGERALKAAESVRRKSLLVDAARALALDDPAAADLLDRIGYRLAEAAVRVRTAERLAAEGRHVEADATLRRALDVYRSVGAPVYVEQAERLLARVA